MWEFKTTHKMVTAPYRKKKAHNEMRAAALE